MILFLLPLFVLFLSNTIQVKMCCCFFVLLFILSSKILLL